MESVYTLIAGVNGAGKSTLYHLGNLLPANQERVNSDEILKENKGNWKDLNDQMEAMKEAVKRIRTYLKNGISFNQETTLAGNSIISNIKKAKERGFKVQMYYVGLESADLAVQRVANRVRVGGHGIKEEEIRKRYKKSLENLLVSIDLCDVIYVYDNTVGFRQVAVFECGKLKGNKIDECKWLENMFNNSFV